MSIGEMFSSATPETNLDSPQPCLSFKETNDHLITFNRLHKLLMEVVEKVSGIYNSASTELISLVDASNKKVLELTKGSSSKSTSSSLAAFLSMYLGEVEKQANSMRTLQTSLQESVVKPLRHVVCQRKELWKTCFRYADSLTQQIVKHDAEGQKCYKKYSEAAEKVKPYVKEKQSQIFHDLHNTYVLKRISVSSVHDVFQKDVLPHIMDVIKSNHEQLNNNYHRHINNMVSLQNTTWNEMIESNVEMLSTSENLNFNDLRIFSKLSTTNLPSFSLPNVDQLKVGIPDNQDSVFVINEQTRPNLQRRRVSLERQTQQLVEEVSSLREGKEFPLTGSLPTATTPSLNILLSSLNICVKEAKLNVLLKQLDLYTPSVVHSLGPMADNLLLESKESKQATTGDMDIVGALGDNSRPHEFKELKVMKSCVYCKKLIVKMRKGYVCKICKISVHKKCATNVKFCELSLLTHKEPTAPPESDLIFFEIDDEFEDGDDYGEFDDGLSEDESGSCSGSMMSLDGSDRLYPVLFDPCQPPIRVRSVPTKLRPTNESFPTNVQQSQKGFLTPQMARKPHLSSHTRPKSVDWGSSGYSFVQPEALPPSPLLTPHPTDATTLGTSDTMLTPTKAKHASSSHNLQAGSAPLLYPTIGSHPTDRHQSIGLLDKGQPKNSNEAIYAKVGAVLSDELTDNSPPPLPPRRYLEPGAANNPVNSPASPPVPTMIPSIKDGNISKSNTNNNGSNKSNNNSSSSYIDDLFNKVDNLISRNLISLNPIDDDIASPSCRPLTPQVARKPHLSGHTRTKSADWGNAGYSQVQPEALPHSPLLIPHPADAPKLGFQPPEDLVASTMMSDMMLTPTKIEHSLPSQNATVSQQRSDGASTTQQFCVSLYDLKGRDDSYLSLCAGSRLQLIEKSNDDWWYGSNMPGVEGYFPSQYVLEMHSTEERIAKVAFDFMSEHEMQLSVQEGEVVLVVNEEDDWLRVRSNYGDGLIPASYAQYI